jgi:hypothetical protein
LTKYENDLEKLIWGKIHIKHPVLFQAIIRQVFDCLNKESTVEKDTVLITLSHKEKGLLEQKKISFDLIGIRIDEHRLTDLHHRSDIEWFLNNKTKENTKPIASLCFKVFSINMEHFISNLYELSETKRKNILYGNIIHDIDNAMLSMEFLRIILPSHEIQLSLIKENLYQWLSIFKKLEHARKDENEDDKLSTIYKTFATVSVQTTNLKKYLNNVNAIYPVNYLDQLFAGEKKNTTEYLKTLVIVFYLEILSMTEQEILFGSNQKVINVFEQDFKRFFKQKGVDPEELE